MNLESDHCAIGNEVVFGSNVSIRAESIEIEDKVIFHDNVSIFCRGAVKVGHHSIIGEGTRVHCNTLSIGHWLYSCEGVEIGAGGCNGVDSNVSIGNFVGIFERVLINPSSEVRIGSNSGIGREAQIWTHGAWLDPLGGFPSDFGPVTVGSNVWLPARTILLPNSEIGDDCVVMINSVVTTRIPTGSIAAGSPARVIRANTYPAPLSEKRTAQFIERVLADWRRLIEFKVPDLRYEVANFDGCKIRLDALGESTVFDCAQKTVEGVKTVYSEDLRDYLRRRGIKIFTDDHFKSVP